MNSKKDTVKNQRCFQEEWLNEPVLKGWLHKDSKDKTKTRLPLVIKLELSSSDRSAITDHVKVKKHLQGLRKVNSFFSLQKKEK